MALTLTAQLSSHVVVNAKHKQEIKDLCDVSAIQTCPKVRDSFSLPIEKFKADC